MSQTLLLLIVILLASASLVDHILNEAAVRQWREATYRMRLELDKMDADTATRRANQWFLSLFDAIYGSKMLSRKRVIRSLLSSSGFVLLLFISFSSPEHLHEVGDFPKIKGVIYLTAFFCSNLMADFLSIQETRFVMGYSYGRRPLVVIALFLADLCITLSIFLLTWMTMVGFFRLVAPFPVSPFSEWLSQVPSLMLEFIRASLLPKSGEETIVRVFTWSTFMTSAMWFGFVLVVLLLRIGLRLSPLLKLSLMHLSRSPRPMTALVGFVCAPLIVALVVAIVSEQLGKG